MKIKLLMLILLAMFMLSCADSGGSGDPIDEETPVEDQKNELLSSIDLSGVTALAIKPRSYEFTWTDRILGFIGIQTAIASIDCNELGGVLDATYTELSTGESVPCFLDGSVEFWGTEKIYAQYFMHDQAVSPSTLSIASQTVFSILTDASGDVHHLPGHPIQPTGFKNRKRVESNNGEPTYINHESKLVKYNFGTSSEDVEIDEVITNFSIKAYTDGDHYIVDATSNVKRIKPDLSEEILPELTLGNYHDIGGSIQYVDGGKFKRMIFDDDGNITDRSGYANPEAWNAFIFDPAVTVPPGHILYGGSISGCTDEAVGDQRIMVCNGKAFRVGADDEDLEEINWIDYGHASLNSWETIKTCTAENYLYFYAESDFQGTRLTWINDFTGEFRDILDTHLISDLECISDSELAVIGTIGELTETLSITGADTISPVILVIDSQITEVITP